MNADAGQLVGRGFDGEYARTFGLISGSTAEEPFKAPDSECIYSSVLCLSRAVRHGTEIL